MTADERFRWRAGLHPLEESAWLEVDDAWAAEVAHKREVRRSAPDSFVALDGSEHRCREAVGAIERRLVADHPERFARRGGVVAPVVAVGPAVETDHPLDRVAQLVQEDLILLDVVDDVTVTTAASVCFPTRWSPTWALGRPVAEVHGPVPRAAGRFTRAIDAAIARLTPGGAGVWRYGWTLTTDPSLRLPPGRPSPPPPDDPERVGTEVWLRVERQTLRRFDGGTVLFTVRVRRWPLADAVPSAAAAAELGEELGRMPEEVLAYKGLTDLVGPARRWCGDRSAGAGTASPTASAGAAPARSPFSGRAGGGPGGSIRRG